MHTRTTAATVAVLLLATLTACGTEPTPDKPAAAASPSTMTSTAPAYTFQDCVDLLEYDYKAGTPKDAQQDPECSHLTKDEYVKAVGQVLGTHKEDIVGQAAREALWDDAWSRMTAAQQTQTCNTIRSNGVDAAGAALAEGAAQPTGHEAEMAQYILDEKC